MLVEDFEIRMCSPDFQTDWGVVGDPITATLVKVRTGPAIFDLTVSNDSPAAQYLRRSMCGIQVKFRGKVEFLGHVYDREGGILKSSTMTVWAAEETEVFDWTLAAPVPWTVAAGSGDVAAWYSSGQIEPTALDDSAQAFPSNHESAGHYAWAYPFVSMAGFPSKVGEFLAPMLQANLARVGYDRGTVRSGGSAATSLANTGDGAPYTIVSDTNWASGVTLTPPPWVSGFDGMLPRFQTLREVVTPFMEWADENTERSFNLFVDGGIGQPITVGIRQAPAKYKTVLSEKAGTVVDGRWRSTDHTGSRVVLGGPGDVHERLFVERRYASRETTGRVVERFRDSSSAKLRYAGLDVPPVGDGAYAAYPRRYFLESRPTTREKAAVRASFAQTGGKELADSAAKYALSAVLQESGSVSYGGTAGYQLGQIVPIDVGADVPQTGRIEKVTISLTKANGLTVVPEIGSTLRGNSSKIASAVRAIANRSRRDASDR